MDNYGSAAAAGGLAVYYIICLAVCAVVIVAQWKIFTKAGEAGWKAIVPFVNCWTLFKIVTGSGARMFMTLIPVFGEIYFYIVMFKLAKAFGKSNGFGVGMIFLSPIFECILAFDNSEYIGPQA